MNVKQILETIGVDKNLYNVPNGQTVVSPIDATEIATVKHTTRQEYEAKVLNVKQAQINWRVIPAPQRGEVIRLFGEELRKYKNELGRLVTIENGKIFQEGLGEVQEMIDICDFAVGLSRQLYGLTMPSERPGHRMQEMWNPLGVVGVVSAFNFPVAVWSWNFAIATVCGNSTIWKPSPKTPLVSFACEAIFKKAVERSGIPQAESILEVVVGANEHAEWLADDKHINLVSLTGSTAMGQALGKRVTERFGRVLMELGGNNAMIVTPNADMDLAIRAILFSAVGTAGQRCTTLRRVIAHRSIYEKLVKDLKKYYAKITVGDPLDKNTLVGPLVSEQAYENMKDTMTQCEQQGIGVVTGGTRLERNGVYVTPALVELNKAEEITKTETFAPLLYIIPYDELAEAVLINNNVPQGLSSCIFTKDLQEAELFIGANGSDCGIVNVNIGPSGAEIGGAFGGEKHTGGGRESGSDAWKQYMRRSTVTVNYSTDLPLAQGVEFNV
jgi:aldehyde dehydrogenase (NAD+)|tara:strand:+ start:172 stop:1668 length:1497 start_codon:yes stop_codon:yes gene_type:complete